MRQLINLPPSLKKCVKICSEKTHYSESLIISFCVSKVMLSNTFSMYNDYNTELNYFAKYFNKSLPRGKKARSK